MAKDEEQRQQEIRQHLGRLSSRNWQIRKDAAVQLGRLRGGPRALSAIVQNDPNGEVRAASAAALGFQRENMDDATYSQAVGALLSAIDDADDRVAVAAITALGLLQAASAREQLEECLDFTGQVPVVAAAVVALSRLGAVDLAERLAKYIESEDRNLSIAGVRAAGTLKYSRASERIFSMLEALLYRYKDSADDRWARGDMQLAICCTEALGAIGAVEAESLLIETAQHSVGLRTKAVEALVKLGSLKAAPLLVGMLKDPSNSLRRSILRLFKAADYRAGIQVVRDLLYDEQMLVRNAALSLIGEWQDTESIAAMRQMCYADPSPKVRPRAMTVLVSLAGDRAIPDLVPLTADSNTQVRRAAARLLSEFANLPAEALEALDKLRHEDPYAFSADPGSTASVGEIYTGDTQDNRDQEDTISTIPTPSTISGNVREAKLDGPLKVAREAVKLMHDFITDPGPHQGPNSAKLFRLFLESIDRDMGPGTVAQWVQAVEDSHNDARTEYWFHRTNLQE